MWFGDAASAAHVALRRPFRLDFIPPWPAICYMWSRSIFVAFALAALIACSHAVDSKSLGSWTLTGSDLSIVSKYIRVRFSHRSPLPPTYPWLLLTLWTVANSRRRRIFCFGLRLRSPLKWTRPFLNSRPLPSHTVLSPLLLSLAGSSPNLVPLLLFETYVHFVFKITWPPRNARQGQDFKHLFDHNLPHYRATFSIFEFFN